MSLTKLSYLKTLKAHKDIKTQSLPSVNIAVLRNITIEPVESYLSWYLAEKKLKATCTFGDFDTIFQDSLNREIVNNHTQTVIIAYDLAFAFEKIIAGFYQLSEKEKQDTKQDFIQFANNIISNIRSLSDATIVWNSFISPLFTSRGIADSQYNNQSLKYFVNQLNSELHHLCQQYNDVYVVDSEQLLSRIGHEAFYDINKGIEYAAPYSNFALQCFAQQYATIIGNTLGKVKKCLILDCDNTLWKGVIGEDGLDGIELGNTLIGKQFQLFQKYVYELSKQGVVLALCSKNNANDVIEVFKHHANMILPYQCITLSKINWQNKAENIDHIAKALNLGLDSIVFIDDSPNECELVKQLLPSVTTIQMQAEPIKTIHQLQADGLFDNLYFTTEDVRKTEQYKQQATRHKLESSFNNIDDYIQSLNIKLVIERSPKEHAKRITQLCQKTNQFNLTSQRLSLAQVENLLDNDNNDIFTCQASDKFGDLGIIGAVFVEYKNHNEVLINNFLLSCRALGRKIQHALLHTLCKYFFERGYHTIIGNRVNSDRNQQTETFYSENHFTEVSKNSDQQCFQLVSSCLPSTNTLSMFTIDHNFSEKKNPHATTNH